MEKTAKKRKFPPSPPKKLEAAVRDWEWTWTKAVLFSLGFAFFILFTQAVIPSFWFYFSEGTLGWRDGLKQMLAEAIALGWITTTFGGILVTAVVLQNWRRKLRGHDHIRRGYGSRA